VRLDPPVFAVKEKVIAPLPEPLVAPVIVIHDVLLTAVQSHPAPALIVNPPDAADGIASKNAGKIENEQPLA